MELLSELEPEELSWTLSLPLFARFSSVVGDVGETEGVECAEEEEDGESSLLTFLEVDVLD